jgi:hypothetical protein
MKNFFGLAVLVFGFAAAARGQAIEPTMYSAPSELVELARGLRAQIGNCTGHCVQLSWTLSVDDDVNLSPPVNCTTAAACSQNIYRSAGGCSSTTTFGAPLTSVAANATTFTDTTIKVGQSYCYALAFVLNAAASNFSNSVSAVILPAPQTGVTEQSK